MLLERATELAAVEQLVDGTTAVGGRVVLIDGEAGIGKTGLVAAARRHAVAAGLRVLAARGAELEGDLAFGVVRELFGPVAAERPLQGVAALAAPALTVGTPPTGRDLSASLHGLYWLTADLAAAGPVLVLVDDAHWCDVASLRFLAHLAGRLDGLSVSMLVATRPVTDGPRADLVRSLGASGSVLRPGPLGPAAVRALVAARLGEPDPAFVEACRDATGGNPFLLGELLAELSGTEPSAGSATRVGRIVPREVNRSVRLRLAGLDPGTAAVARAVAVLGEAPVGGTGRGDGVASAVVAQLAGVEEGRVAPALDELVAIRLLDTDHPARFRHPLLRAAVVSTLGPAALATSHRQAAAALAGAGDDAVLPHLMASAPAADADVVDTLRRAAAAAVARGAPDSAASILERALAEPPAPRLRAAVELELGAAQLRAGAPTAADHLAAAADTLPDPVGRARATLVLARALLHRGEVAEAVRRCGLAIDDVGPVDPDLALELEAELVTIASQDPSTRAASVARHARRGADPAPDSRGACMLLAAMGLEEVYTAGSRERALTLAERSLSGGHLVREQFVARLLGTGITLTLAGRPERAVGLWDEVIDGLAERGDAAGFALASAFRGYAAHHAGDLRAALADTRQALELSAGSPTQLITRGFAAAWQTYGLIDAGDLDEADELLTADAALFERGVSSVYYLYNARGRLRLAQGRLDQAVDDLEECGRRLAAAGARGPATCPWRAPLALALLGRGDRDRARTVAAETVGLARAWGAAVPLAEALRTAGLIEGGPGGIALVEEAVRVAGEVPLERARAEATLGGVLRRGGRRADATRTLRGAVERALAAGADGIAGPAQADLGTAGGRPPTVGAPALTPTQRRVAGLAATGMTNRAIAQSLFVSERTIETHLGHAFRVLGISGRARLAEFLDE